MNMEALLKKNQEAQLIINQLTSQIEILKKNGLNISKFEAEGAALMKENKELADQISAMKTKLTKTELLNGEIQYDVPEAVISQKPVTELVKPADKVEVAKQDVKETTGAKEQQPPKGEKKAKKPTNEAIEVVDVSRFDMRIGKILEISKHPEADTLYVEQVDVGEDKPRQIISGLVKFSTESELLGRLAVFLVNLKPAKMRGVMSEGMIMCASAPEQGIVEPLLVPAGVKPGDRVTVEGYDGAPDDMLNPKKKILETVKPELRVNADGIATYRGARWQVNGQPGVIVSSKLKDVQIA